MTPENFVYWLQGFLEIEDPKTINEQQVQIIKDHVALVLKKETPNRFYLQNDNMPKITFSVPPQTDGLTDFSGLATIAYGGSC